NPGTRIKGGSKGKTAKGRSALCEAVLDHPADGSHIGATQQGRTYGRHDLAHILDAAGADFCDCLADDALQLLFGDRPGHELLQDDDFRVLYIREVLATSGLILGNRLAALLDHLVEHADDAAVVRINTFVNFDLLDLGQ